MPAVFLPNEEENEEKMTIDLELLQYISEVGPDRLKEMREHCLTTLECKDVRVLKLLIDALEGHLDTPEERERNLLAIARFYTQQWSVRTDENQRIELEKEVMGTLKQAILHEIEPVAYALSGLFLRSQNLAYDCTSLFTERNLGSLFSPGFRKPFVGFLAAIANLHGFNDLLLPLKDIESDLVARAEDNAAIALFESKMALEAHLLGERQALLAHLDLGEKIQFKQETVKEEVALAKDIMCTALQCAGEASEFLALFEGVLTTEGLLGLAEGKGGKDALQKEVISRAVDLAMEQRD